MAMQDVLSVRRFFDGKAIFVTGATGFLGKSVIEKLLTTCNVRKIYFLLRAKKGVSFEERSKNFRKDPLFKFRVDAAKLDLLTPIAGDISSEDLGISAEDRDTLVSDVDVVIHSAATVKFDEELR